MKTRFETAADIFALMYDANMADTENAADWQNATMAQDLYRDLSNAAKKVLGKCFYQYLMEGDGICLDAAGIEKIWNDLLDN
jgi:hypothetical protein